MQDLHRFILRLNQDQDAAQGWRKVVLPELLTKCMPMVLRTDQSVSSEVRDLAYGNMP